jgi:predicted phage terminase large subunit-like protein
VTDLRIAAAKELLRQDEALESLDAFRTYLAPTGHTDFTYAPARHHKVMAAALERLGRGETRRLLILAPPGSAKSTYCSIQFPMQWWARNADKNVLCASNTQTLAEDFNRRRRNLALTTEWQRLAETSLADDLQGVELFGTKRQGRMRAVGVEGSIVGFRSHLNILDDPISGVMEAMSPTALEKQWKWFVHEFRQRLVPNGSELIVSTRWAKRDIAGRIIELVKAGKEDWEILRLPYLADRTDDPLGRAIGEPLWPEWYTDEKIEREQRDVFLWSTQYQQTPLDESGSWVTADQIESCFEDKAPEDLRTVVAFDLALSVGKGDWTVIAAAGLDAEGTLHILEIKRERVDPQTTALRLFDFADFYEPIEVLADDDNATKVFRSGLHETAKRNGRVFALNLLPMRGKDKETRAAPLRMLFMSGRIRIVRGPWNGDLVRELLDWETDDQIDALGLIARRLPVLPRPTISTHADESKNVRFTRGADGVVYLTSGLDEMFEQRDQRVRANRGRV